MPETIRETIEADYIIIGGGSAGAVLANRLTEDPGKRVLLLEAGGAARSFLVQMPAGMAKLITNTEFDWCYAQAPDPSINDRRFIWSAGKMLGGGSSINGQVYIRGTRRDFDYLAETGAPGWSFAEVFPYFLRSENWAGPMSQVHGSQGPLTVSPMREFHPLSQNFLRACNENGLPTLAEHNGGDMEGAFLTQATQRDGWRCSTEKAYLRPVEKRANLQILTGAEVDTIRFEGKRAAGVVFTQAGARITANAAREVIVSAGAMGSPALLMRSGVGPGAHLQSHGIDVVYDSPQVGQNLQEHPCVGQNKFVNIPTLNSQTSQLDLARHMLRFLMVRKGPMATPAVQAMALARTRDGLDEPDVQLHFAPFGYDIEPETQSAALAVMPKEPTMTIMATICHPHSRGRVELGEGKKPHVVHQFFGDARDIETLVGGMKLVDKIFASKALSGSVIGDRVPSTAPDTDAGWEDFIRMKATPSYHPVGSCRMGEGEDAAVDSQLRVKGLENLRVVDASVLPRITSANTNATAIMIGEKAAELIATSNR